MDSPAASDRGNDDPELDDATVDRLIEAARSASDHAYAPYSRFPVGAAVLTADGTVIPGVNVENVSSGLTVCGERVAIFTAAAQGHRQLRAVAVSAPRNPGTTPCGACRQVMAEFRPAGGDVAVLLDHRDRIERTTLSSLLPRSFGPDALESVSS